MIPHPKLVVGALAVVGLTTPPCVLCGSRSLITHPPVVSGQVLDTATVKLQISGMTCGSCATTARLALEKLDGVLEAKVSVKDSLGVVRYDPRKVRPAQIAEHLTRLTGYSARIIADPAKSAPQPPR